MTGRLSSSYPEALQIARGITGRIIRFLEFDGWKVTGRSGDTADVELPDGSRWRITVTRVREIG